jgi:hypothetical protein
MVGERGPRRTVVLSGCKYMYKERKVAMIQGLSILCKRSGLDATASGSGRNGASDESTSMLHIFAIAAHAPLVTVEDGRRR